MNSNQSFNNPMPEKSFPGALVWGITLTLLLTGLFLLRSSRAQTQNPETARTAPETGQGLAAKSPNAIPVDLMYEDPVPQTVFINESGQAAPEMSEILQQPWMVLMAESPDRESVERLQRVFSKRRIDLLLRTPDNVYMACIRFSTEAEANEELADLELHSADLAPFGVQPRVVNLKDYLQKRDIP